MAELGRAEEMDRYAFITNDDDEIVIERFCGGFIVGVTPGWSEKSTSRPVAFELTTAEAADLAAHLKDV